MAQPTRTRSPRTVPTGERDLMRFADALRANDRDVKSLEGVFGTAAELAALVSAGGISIGTWTPTFTFATPGDLSVSYVDQNGAYIRVGELVLLNLQLRFTPTHTTASGAAMVEGLPFTAQADLRARTLLGHPNANLTYPAGCTSAALVAASGQSALNAVGQGSGANAFITATEVPSASEQRWDSIAVYAAS